MSCFRWRRIQYKRKTKTSAIGVCAYIQQLKSLDALLSSMILRIQKDIENAKYDKAFSKKNIARRRIMLKKHLLSIENRRNLVYQRIIQLENLHLNELQLSALKNVSKAYKESNIALDDVDNLLDKLSAFKDDFEEINERLTSDLDFGEFDVTEEELMKELEEDEAHEDSFSTIPLELPNIHQGKSVKKETNEKIKKNREDKVPLLN
jgi:hypothetical protein